MYIVTHFDEKSLQSAFNEFGFLRFILPQNFTVL